MIDRYHDAILREFGGQDTTHVTISGIRGRSGDDTGGVYITHTHRDETHLLPDRHVLDRIIWAVLGEIGGD